MSSSVQVISNDKQKRREQLTKRKGKQHRRSLGWDFDGAPDTRSKDPVDDEDMDTEEISNGSKSKYIASKGAKASKSVRFQVQPRHGASNGKKPERVSRGRYQKNDPSTKPNVKKPLHLSSLSRRPPHMHRAPRRLFRMQRDNPSSSYLILLTTKMTPERNMGPPNA